MKFNKDNKVIISSLNNVEADAFVLFLEEENIRHAEDINEVELKIMSHSLNTKWNSAYRILCESAIRRHGDDISESNKLIERVKEGMCQKDTLIQ